jgi:hypothetical protein
VVSVVSLGLHRYYSQKTPLCLIPRGTETKPASSVPTKTNICKILYIGSIFNNALAVTRDYKKMKWRYLNDELQSIWKEVME